MKVIKIAIKHIFNILGFYGHHMRPQKLTSLCLLIFMNLIHSQAVRLFDILLIIGNLHKYLFPLVNACSEYIFANIHVLDLHTYEPSMSVLTFVTLSNWTSNDDKVRNLS